MADSHGPVEALHDASRILFAEMRNRGIPAAALRDDPYGTPPPKDLDFLIGPSSEPDTRALLQELGYVTRTPPNPESHKFVAFKPLSGAVIHVLDIHTAFVQNEMVYMDVERALARRVDRGEYFALSNEDEYLHLLFHELISRDQMRPEKCNQIQGLLAQGLDDSVLDEQLSLYGMIDLYQDSIKGNIDLLTSDAAAFRRVQQKIVRRLSGQIPLLRRLMRIGHLDIKIHRLLLRKRAPLIAFVGPDGTGKSTLVERLAATMEATAAVSAKTTYLGPWGHYNLIRFFPGGVHDKELPDPASLTKPPEEEDPPRLWQALGIRLKQLGGRPLEENQRSVLERAERYSPGYSRIMRRYHDLRFLIFLSFLLFEYAVRFYRVRENQSRGYTVLSDRYVDDLLLGSMHAEVKRNQPKCRFFRSLMPRPDLMVVLIADPNRVHERKQDLDLETLIRFNDFYTALGQASNAVILEANAAPETVLDQFLSNHLRSLVPGADPEGRA